jgi:hypothetical protein
MVGQEPQRGGLFIVTSLPGNGPNPSGVTCGGLFAGSELPIGQQVTPLGFGLRQGRGKAINRPPLRGFCGAHRGAHTPNQRSGGDGGTARVWCAGRLSPATPHCDRWAELTLLMYDDSARNEWICWVTSAKQEATRERRIEVGIDKMRGGMRRPCCWPGCPHR